MAVKNDKGHCSQLGDGYGPLFTYDWPGIQQFYLDSYKKGPAVQNKKYGQHCNASLTETITKEVLDSHGEFKEVSYSGISGGSAFPMIQISSFQGKQICAKYSKLNYNTIQFVKEDGTCPEGHKVCETSYRKDKSNFICIPGDVAVAACPVRDMHLISKDAPD